MLLLFIQFCFRNAEWAYKTFFRRMKLKIARQKLVEVIRMKNTMPPGDQKFILFKGISGLYNHTFRYKFINNFVLVCNSFETDVRGPFALTRDGVMKVYGT